MPTLEIRYDLSLDNFLDVISYEKVGQRILRQRQQHRIGES
jgi:hypothetical protein